jgi:RNA polymerase sigma-70 factor, ECF subfamily
MERHDITGRRTGHTAGNSAAGSLADRRFDDAWRDDRAYVVDRAARMLGSAAEAEDVVQDAFIRLTRVDITEIDDVRGWLAVVVRRLCLDRIGSAHSRRESATGTTMPDGSVLLRGRGGDGGTGDPADRVTLDDQVQRALAVVLDRLSPAERTSFVLHDVFGFGFDSVAEIVGRTPVACRQLASRARRAIRLRDDADPSTGDDTAGGMVADSEPARHRLLAERFIAACAGGDIAELMHVLDPDVVGEATLFGHGPLVRLEGRPAVMQRLIGMFGPGTESLLVPFVVERAPGVVVFTHDRLAAVVRLDANGDVIHHLKSFVVPPAGARGRDRSEHDGRAERGAPGGAS